MKELIKKIIELIGIIWKWVKEKRIKVNHQMLKVYTPVRFTIYTTVICGLAAVVILFLPNYLGVANDNLGNEKMQEYGLAYLEKDTLGDDGFLSNEYFTRTYLLTGKTDYCLSVTTVFFLVAKKIDNLLTGDRLFDVRFLAAVYFVIYIPLLYLTVLSALKRISFFSEAVVISGLAVLIFSDLSYITYMNSLYENPIIFLCFIGFFGGAMSLREKNKYEPLYLLILFISGITLILTEKRFFLTGIILSAFIVLIFKYYKSSLLRIFLGMMMAISLFSMVFCLFYCDDTFGQMGKYHSVSRGILLNNDNPVNTLAELGIDPSYSVLAGTSLYDYYPISEIENELIQKGFLDKFTETDILLYYLRSPFKLVSMWNLGVVSAMSEPRDYCSNYERSAGYPAKAKSIFWSAWSFFRQRSLPKTIGYFVLLVVVFIALSYKKAIGKRQDRKAYIYLLTMISITLIGVIDLTYVIVRSGDAQLVQYQGTMTIVMDLLLFGCAVEGLNRLNILEEEHE